MFHDEIMIRMGFPPTAKGPHIDLLRERIRDQAAQGLVYRSGGTWAPGSESMTLDGRAKHLLAWEWAIERGHYSTVRAIDGLTVRSLIPWVGDRLRDAAMRLRVWRDRRVTNPYL